jgi:hypothetical protein
MVVSVLFICLLFVLIEAIAVCGIVKSLSNFVLCVTACTEVSLCGQCKKVTFSTFPGLRKTAGRVYGYLRISIANGRFPLAVRLTGSCH